MIDITDICEGVEGVLPEPDCGETRRCIVFVDPEDPDILLFRAEFAAGGRHYTISRAESVTMLGLMYDPAHGVVAGFRNAVREWEAGR